MGLLSLQFLTAIGEPGRLFRPGSGVATARHDAPFTTRGSVVALNLGYGFGSSAAARFPLTLPAEPGDDIRSTLRVAFNIDERQVVAVLEKMSEAAVAIVALVERRLLSL